MEGRTLKCGCFWNQKEKTNAGWKFCKEAERLLLISRKFRKDFKYRVDYDSHFNQQK